MEKSNKSIIEYIPDFLDYCEVEKGLSSKTQENYKRYLDKFIWWLKKTKNEDLKPYELTKDHIWEYRLFLSRYQDKKGHSLKKISQNYYLIALRALLSYFTAKDRQCIASDKIVLPKDAKREKTLKFLNLEQIEKLLLTPNIRNPSGLRDRAILESFFSTGLRIAELVALNREQFTNIKDKKDLELGIIGKGGTPRTVYFSERALSWLKKYLETRKDKEKALFIHYQSKKGTENRLTSRSIERILKKYVILAGVPFFTTPHTLRHCLHPLTRVIATNQIISAQELFFRNPPPIFSLNFKDLSLKKSKIIRKTYHIAPLYSIWADGYNLVCSPLHRIFTLGKNGIEEKRIKELKIGDFIAGIKKVNLEGKKYFNPDLWRLIGYVLGDGTVSSQRRGIIINDKNPEFLKFYQKLTKKLLNYFPKIKKSSGRNSYQINIYNKELVEFLKDLGLDKKSKNLRIPRFLLSATKKEVAQFLAGYYDAEGNSGRIRLFSSSLELLKDVQMCLLRFGIDSHINKRKRTVTLPQKRKFTHNFYTLHILHRPDQLLFKKFIPTLKIDNLVIESRYIGEKIPAQKILNNIKKDAKKKKIVWIEELKKNFHINYLGRYLQQMSPVKSTLKKIIFQLEKRGYRSKLLRNLKKIVYSDQIKWLRIKEKDCLPFGRYSTFDFSVTDENLITDGILSHNSYATDLLNQGVDLRTIQEFLGHKSIISTQIYTHVTNKRLRDIHRQFHSGKNLKE